MTRADGWVVVSWWRDADCKSVPPYKGEFQYEWYATSSAADECYRQYAEGEFRRATAIGIFPVKGGKPLTGCFP